MVDVTINEGEAEGGAIATAVLKEPELPQWFKD